jgi:hypothetical protein
MIKTVIALLLLLINLHAVNQSDIVGNWKAFGRALNNGTETIEKEYLRLNPNRTFVIVILVSVKKDESYVKDLRIEVSGTWDSRDDTLVYVIKKINIPTAKEVYLITQKSLENLAANFKYKYENDAIHIDKIKYIDRTTMSIVSERGKETKYKRY